MLNDRNCVDFHFPSSPDWLKIYLLQAQSMASISSGYGTSLGRGEAALNTLSLFIEEFVL